MAPILDTLPELTSLIGLGAVALSLLAVLFAVEQFFLSIPYPPGMPLVREPEGAKRFSLRTRLAYYSDCEALFRDAYLNYSKKGIPVVVPGLGFRTEIIMPQSSMRWVLSQPDELLDVAHAFADVDQVRWSLGHEKIVVDAWQGLIVKTDMNRVLENICAAMNNELGLVFDEQFGTDTEHWKEVELFPTIQIIVAQAASRFTVGMPLCRDKEYLQTALSINQRLIMNAGVTGACPHFLRPVVGRIFEFSVLTYLKKMKKWFLPLYKQRLETLKHDRDDPNYEEPQDQLQMMLRFAEKERPHELHDEELILRRLAANNFGSMHQTALQVTNLILNVLGSDAEFNTIAVLRDEIDRVISSDESELWTKAKVSQMTRSDSIGRETLRLQSFGGRAIFRKVMTNDFKTQEGYHIPRGSILSFLSQPAHLDAENVEDPLKFDPFRFSRIREIAATKDEKVPPVSLVSTGPDFLPFGHGKHACPGRFLIDFELKMILAYVLRNYDIEFPESYNGQRPPNYWLTEAVFPPNGAKVRVKRRVV
ncbi:Fc.00g024050.m01.CDS01 [Cosmosporella sp. VM-42]